MNFGNSQKFAPGSPGSPPTWCRGEKQAVGTGLGASRVWFTIGEGILNEIYYPRIDIPQVRDLGFIIADRQGFWIELKTITQCTIEYVEFGVPSFIVCHSHPRFTFTQRIVPHSNRDVLLLETTLEGDKELDAFVILAPHLGGSGHDNMAKIETIAGRNLLLAEKGPFGLALSAICKTTKGEGFGYCSAGYSGVNDAWQQFNRYHQLKESYQHAGPGNVALTAAIAKHSVLSLGFGSSQESAATLSISALMESFDVIWEQNKLSWQEWRDKTTCPIRSFHNTPMTANLCAQLETSAMVLRCHLDQIHRGALVASLSIPWGNVANERPGYHLVWPRDLVECAGAFVAIGAFAEARDVLTYLIATQNNDGTWNQNQWLGGKPFWTGIQLDQIAFPVLLAGTLADRDALADIPVADMVRSALSYIIQQGPITPQDRWEESSGINPFTLSVCIAAMVSGARFLNGEESELILALADYWNERIEDWTTVSDTELADKFDVEGYYIKVASEAALINPSILSEPQVIKNRWPDPEIPGDEQIALDFLQLVRLGLRRAEDPLVCATLKIADATIKKEVPQGHCWYRYTEDGYGETLEGEAYISSGIGRLWPLLVGERGHYEICLGKDAVTFLEIMSAMAGPGGMLPEQIWDNSDLPEKNLYFGKPTGSATPLAWAHAEYIKLMCSAVTGVPVDRPESVWQRYRGVKANAKTWFWRVEAPFSQVQSSKNIKLLFKQPTTINLRMDDQNNASYSTQLTSLNVHMIELPPMSPHCECRFTCSENTEMEYYFKTV